MRLYKGSIYPINVVFAPCYCQDEEVAISDLVLNFFTTEEETSIEFSGDSITISGFVATVVFQPAQLDALEDGTLRFVSEFNYGGSAIKWSCATDKYLITPPNYTPIEIITEDNLIDILETSTAVTEVIEETVEEVMGDRYYTSGETDNAIQAAIDAQEFKTINGESIIGEGDIVITGGSGSDFSLEYNQVREIEHNDYVAYTFTHSGSTWGNYEAWVAKITNGENSFNYGIWQESPNSGQRDVAYMSGYVNGHFFGNDALTRPMIKSQMASNFYSRFPCFYLKYEQESYGDDNITWTFVVPSSYSVEILSLDNCPGFEFAGSATTEFVEIAPAGAILLGDSFSSQSFARAFHHYIITHRFEEEFAIYAENTWAMQPDQYVEDEGIWQALSFGCGGDGQDIYLTFFSRGGKYMVGWTNTQFLHFGKQAVYELPTASSSTLGGVKIGSGITIDSNGVISASSGISSGEVQTMIDSSLTNYYTSAQTQEYIAEEIFDLPTRDEVEQAISAATANMVTSTYVNNIWVGTTAQYNAITTKDPNTLYFINDN